jgi:hypothetical protein
LSTSPLPRALATDSCLPRRHAEAGRRHVPRLPPPVPLFHRQSDCIARLLLTDKTRIHLRSASVRTYTFFTMGFPRLLSIRGARRLQAFDLPLLTNLPKP